MKKEVLRLLSVIAVLVTVSCTDKQYDLSDIDTTSHFPVNDLIIPLNMSPIKLDNIISIDEEKDGDIKKDAESGSYYFQKKGEKKDGKDYCFKSKDVNIDKITIQKPQDISQEVTVSLILSEGILSNWQNYASAYSIGQILNSTELQQNVSINENTPIFKIEVDNTKTNINLKATNIDKSINKIKKLGFTPLPLNIGINLGELEDVVNNVNFTDLNIDLPCGMEVDGTGNGSYNQANGLLVYGTLSVPCQTTTNIATVKGLDYNLMKGSGGELFDISNHSFTYNKQCQISGTATITAKDLNQNAMLNDIKRAKNQTATCTYVVGFGGDLIVNSFSGGINYTIDDISIDPVKIENLPEILQETGTCIEVANPQLYLNIENPFFVNNITAEAGLRILSSNNIFIPNAPEGQVLTLNEASNNQVLSPENKDHIKHGYKWVKFPELKSLLSGEKIPESLDIKVLNPVLKADDVKDFTLGTDHLGITGNWEFYAKLSLTENSIIKYSKIWDDWGSKDLDGLTVENAIVSFNIKKDIALDADIIFTLNSKNGKKLYGKTSLKEDEQEIQITMEGEPVSNISGGKIELTLKGKGKDINTEQKIEISNLRMKINGYYEKEF